MTTKIIGCFTNAWIFQAKTPAAAKQEGFRQMVGRNKIHWLK